jgi:hypothetical protein
MYDMPALLIFNDRQKESGGPAEVGMSLIFFIDYWFERIF